MLQNVPLTFGTNRGIIFRKEGNNMANYELKSFLCPSCGGQIDPERLGQAKEGNVIVCPYCGVSLNMKKTQDAHEIGYEYQQGVIKATEEYNEKKRREYVAAVRKQQMIAAEQERRRMAAAEARRKKFEKRSWVSAIIIYVILIGLAYVLAHESMAWTFSESLHLPKPWIVDVNGGILCHIAGFFLWGFVKIGVLLSLVSAFVNLGEKTMVAMPWLYLWELFFMVIIFKSMNGCGLFEAFEILIKDLFG